MWALLWKSVHLPSPDTWLEKKTHTFLKSLGGRWSCLLGSVWIITRFFPLQCCLHTSLCWDSPIITKNLRSIKIFKTNCKITKEKLFLKCPKFASVKIRFFPRSREVQSPLNELNLCCSIASQWREKHSPLTTSEIMMRVSSLGGGDYLRDIQSGGLPNLKEA